MADPAHEDMKATARARAAQAWMAEETKDIEVDSRLADAFADILVSEWEDKLLNEAEKRARQLRAQLDRCEEAVSKGRTSEDCRPGDFDWSETLRKALNLYKNYEQERRRTDALVAGGRLSVDMQELWGQLFAVVEQSVYRIVVEHMGLPGTMKDKIFLKLRILLQEALPTLIIPYEKENKTGYTEKLEEYKAWRCGVDEERLLDEFDLALGWFAGQGFSHDEALKAAEQMRDSKER